MCGKDLPRISGNSVISPPKVDIVLRSSHELDVDFDMCDCRRLRLDLVGVDFEKCGCLRLWLDLKVQIKKVKRAFGRTQGNRRE